MSYCRFSCDDYQCDVYVYADINGGFTTHVASNRPAYKSPLPDPVPFDSENFKEWHARHEKVMSMLDDADRIDIGLPHDGEKYNDTTADECADRLEELRNIGYRVPQYAIDALRAEQTPNKTGEQE